MHIPNGTGIFAWLVDNFVTDKYRYTEHRLAAASQQLYAIGAFRSLGGASVESPDAATAELLRAWKKTQASLLARFDSNHDGTSQQPQEWDQARTAARQQVLKDAHVRHAPAFLEHPRSSGGRTRLFAGRLRRRIVGAAVPAARAGGIGGFRRQHRRLTGWWRTSDRIRT